MKSLLFLVLLSLAVVAGLVLFYAGNVSKREAKVLGWANSLVWERLGMPHDVRFSSATLARDEERPAFWRIAGQLEKGAGVPAERYTAVVERICSSAERRCWRLAELEVAGTRLAVDGRRPAKGAGPPGEVSTGQQPPASRAGGTNGQNPEAPSAAVQGAGDAAQKAEASPAVPAPPVTPAGGEALAEPPLPADLSSGLPAGLSSGLSDLRPYPKMPPLPRRRP